MGSFAHCTIVRVHTLYTYLHDLHVRKLMTSGDTVRGASRCWPWQDWRHVLRFLAGLEIIGEFRGRTSSYWATGCWGCDHAWWTCATGWFLNLFNFAVLPAVNSPSDSVGKVMLMGQCLCRNIPFRGAFRAQKNGSRGSAVPQGVHVHAAQFGKNHWIQLNTIEYHWIPHNIEWHVESNWIQLNHLMQLQ